MTFVRASSPDRESARSPFGPCLLVVLSVFGSLGGASERVAKRFPSDVAIYFKHFPLGMHAHSHAAARNKGWTMSTTPKPMPRKTPTRGQRTSIR